MFHYLDVFVIAAPPVSDQCQIEMNALKRVCFQWEFLWQLI